MSEGGARGRGEPPVAPGDLLASLPDVVALVASDGTIAWVSGSPGGALGWTADELVGRSVYDFFAKQVNHELHMEAMARVVAEPGVHGPIEVTVRTSDGRLREVEFMLTNDLDAAAVGFVVAVGRDITDRERESEVFRQRDAWAASLLRAAPELVLVTDRAGSIAYASPSAKRILGFDSSELTGSLLADLVHPDDLLVPPDAATFPDRMLGTGPGRERVVRLRSASGAWPQLRLERNTHHDIGDNYFLFTAREVRDEYDAANLLSEQTLVLERVARGAPIAESLHAICELTARRVGACEVVVGYTDPPSFVSESPTVSSELRAVLARTGISRPPLAVGPVLPTLQGDAAWDSVAQAASNDQFRRVWVVDLPGAEGPIGRLVLLRRRRHDLTSEELDIVNLAVDLATIAVERHHLQARLAHGALHDELTGLPNRRYLLARLRETFGREGVKAGLLFVDLDRFKLINDTLGHEAGDQLLAEVTMRFRRALRPDDLVARVGGDEFVVLCPELDGVDAVAALARRLTDALSSPIDLPGGRVVVSASIGVVHAIGPADPAEVLQDADLAMYDAKERGRNRVALFHGGLREKAIARLEVENALRDALRADEMMLHYQPVVRLRDDHMVGVEALLRWDRPGIGMVKPSAFVPVATDTGLILPLGRWVIQQATKAAARWPELEVAANLSARQLADADLVDFVADCLTRHDVAAQRLCLEVTEADLVTDPDSVVEQLRRFKQLGVRLAIDDFGTGFATLDYLRRFSAADILKVDASFVAGLDDPSKHDLAIVSAALVLADNLGFDAVAEGVETQAQREVLERLGCELAQGHLFSPPVSAAEIDAIVAGGGRVVPGA